MLDETITRNFSERAIRLYSEMVNLNRSTPMKPTEKEAARKLASQERIQNFRKRFFGRD